MHRGKREAISHGQTESLSMSTCSKYFNNYRSKLKSPLTYRRDLICCRPRTFVTDILLRWILCGSHLESCYPLSDQLPVSYILIEIATLSFVSCCIYAPEIFQRFVPTRPSHDTFHSRSSTVVAPSLAGTYLAFGLHILTDWQALSSRCYCFTSGAIEMTMPPAIRTRGRQRADVPPTPFPTQQLFVLGEFLLSLSLLVSAVTAVAWGISDDLGPYHS